MKQGKVVDHGIKRAPIKGFSPHAVGQINSPAEMNQFIGLVRFQKKVVIQFSILYSTFGDLEERENIQEILKASSKDLLPLLLKR